MAGDEYRDPVFPVEFQNQFAHFDDAQRKELFFGFVQPFFVLKGESLVDSSVRDMQVIDECGLFIGIFFNGEHVDIMQYVAHDF